MAKPIPTLTIIRVQNLINLGFSPAQIKKLTGCVGSSITRIRKIMGASAFKRGRKVNLCKLSRKETKYPPRISTSLIFNQVILKGKFMKYYIDEPDIGNMDCPLIGPRKDTRFFDSKEEAEREAEKMEARSEICFCVWQFDDKPTPTPQQ